MLRVIPRYVTDTQTIVVCAECFLFHKDGANTVLPTAIISPRVSHCEYRVSCAIPCYVYHDTVRIAMTKGIPNITLEKNVYPLPVTGTNRYRNSFIPWELYQ